MCKGKGRDWLGEIKNGEVGVCVYACCQEQGWEAEASSALLWATHKLPSHPEVEG